MKTFLHLISPHFWTLECWTQIAPLSLIALTASYPMPWRRLEHHPTATQSPLVHATQMGHQEVKNRLFKFDFLLQSPYHSFEGFCGCNSCCLTHIYSQSTARSWYFLRSPQDGNNRNSENIVISNMLFGFGWSFPNFCLLERVKCYS